jgi:hypothetical protein
MLTFRRVPRVRWHLASGVAIASSPIARAMLSKLSNNLKLPMRKLGLRDNVNRPFKVSKLNNTLSDSDCKAPAIKQRVLTRFHSNMMESVIFLSLGSS